MRDRPIAARSTDLCAAYRSISSAALSTDCANRSNARNINNKNCQHLYPLAWEFNHFHTKCIYVLLTNVVDFLLEVGQKLDLDFLSSQGRC